MFWTPYQTRLLESLNYKVNILMATLQNVVDAANAETSVDQSIVTMLNGIAQQLKDAQASNDPAALDAVVATIQSNTKILSDAITANTPAAPIADTSAPASQPTTAAPQVSQ